MRVRHLLWKMKNGFHIKMIKKKKTPFGKCLCLLVPKNKKISRPSLFYICEYFCKEGRDCFVSKNNPSLIPIILGQDYLVMSMYRHISVLYTSF